MYRGCLEKLDQRAGDLDRENKFLGQEKDLGSRMGLDSNFLGVGRLPSMSHLPYVSQLRIICTL